MDETVGVRLVVGIGLFVGEVVMELVWDCDGVGVGVSVLDEVGSDVGDFEPVEERETDLEGEIDA